MSHIKEFWDEYRKNFWEVILKQIRYIDDEFIHSIFFWGVVKYNTYFHSIFYSNCKITVQNENLHVFFISRVFEVKSEKKIRHYFFTSTIADKQRILNSQPRCEEERFIKILYLYNLSFSDIFSHKYSWKCWLSIVEMENNCK